MRPPPEGGGYGSIGNVLDVRFERFNEAAARGRRIRGGSGGGRVGRGGFNEAAARGRRIPPPH